MGRGRDQDLRLGRRASDPIRSTFRNSRLRTERDHVGSARGKRKVAAHSHGDLSSRLAVEAGVDSIEHGSFLTEKTLQLMKQKGVYLVPTRLALYWTSKQIDTYPPAIADKARAAARSHRRHGEMALRIGVPIASHRFRVSPHGMNAKESRY